MNTKECVTPLLGVKMIFYKDYIFASLLIVPIHLIPDFAFTLGS